MIPVMRWLLVGAILLITAAAIAAQTDEPLIAPIQPDTTVTETISAAAAFDWWRFTALAGETYRVQMLTDSDLQPLLGIINPNGSMFMRSDQGGDTATSQADLAVIEFVIPADGEYTISASGTNGTTGSYRLTLQRVQGGGLDTANPTALTVTFPCNGRDAAALAGVQFSQDEGDDGSYPVYIYGADGLHPVIRFQAPEQNILFCAEDASQAAGDQYTLPDGDSYTMSASQLENASLLTINAQGDLGNIILTFGAADGTRGRYIALVGGFHLEPGSENDTLRVRLAPLPAQNSGLTVYMIAVGANSRLDPFLMLSSAAGETLAVCDDAGRRPCLDVPPISGAGIILHDGTRFTGSRFDAGVHIPAGSTEWHTITPSSFGGNTTGDYALLLVGEFPPAEELS